MDIKNFLKKHIVIDNRVYFFSALMSYQARTTFAVLIEKKLVKDLETKKDKIIEEKLHLPIGTLLERINHGFAHVISNEEAIKRGQVVE